MKRRITANIPDDLLHEATLVTKAGITETLIIGLELIRRHRAYELASQLKGKLTIEIDVDESRERHRR